MVSLSPLTRRTKASRQRVSPLPGRAEDVVTDVGYPNSAVPPGCQFVGKIVRAGTGTGAAVIVVVVYVIRKPVVGRCRRRLASGRRRRRGLRLLLLRCRRLLLLSQKHIYDTVFEGDIRRIFLGHFLGVHQLRMRRRARLSGRRFDGGAGGIVPIALLRETGSSAVTAAPWKSATVIVVLGQAGPRSRTSGAGCATGAIVRVASRRRMLLVGATAAGRSAARRIGRFVVCLTASGPVGRRTRRFKVNRQVP